MLQSLSSPHHLPTQGTNGQSIQTPAAAVVATTDEYPLLLNPCCGPCLQLLQGACMVTTDCPHFQINAHQVGAPLPVPEIHNTRFLLVPILTWDHLLFSIS